MKPKLETAAYVLAIVYIGISIYGLGIKRGKVACIEAPSNCIKEYATQKGIPFPSEQRDLSTLGGSVL
jgi:hypothetical protein